METKQLTTEEIQQLKEIQQKRIQITEQFGIVEVQAQEIQIQKDFLKESLIKLRQEEMKIGTDLQQKYGDGNINLEKGEFNSI